MIPAFFLIFHKKYDVINIIYNEDKGISNSR